MLGHSLLRNITEGRSKTQHNNALLASIHITAEAIYTVRRNTTSVNSLPLGKISILPVPMKEYRISNSVTLCMRQGTLPWMMKLCITSWTTRP